MAKKVNRLYERLCKLRDDLERIMPAKYRETESVEGEGNGHPCDSVCECWRAALDGLYAADDYLCDLASLLEWRAGKHATPDEPDDAADALDDEDDGQTEPEANDAGNAVPAGDLASFGKRSTIHTVSTLATRSRF